MCVLYAIVVEGSIIKMSDVNVTPQKYLTFLKNVSRFCGLTLTSDIWNRQKPGNCRQLLQCSVYLVTEIAPFCVQGTEKNVKCQCHPT